jgi:hypothetical protein
VEFSTEGRTKSERALNEIPGQKPEKFVRFSRSFIAMEDAGAHLLGTLGTWAGSSRSGRRRPRLRSTPVTTIAKWEVASFALACSQDGVAAKLRRPALRIREQTAPARRFVLCTDLLRFHAESAPGDLRFRHTMQPGTTQDFLTDQALAAVRVDVDDADEAAR